MESDLQDPIPAPSACVDGIQRHMQQYEQTIASLQLENQQLRQKLQQLLQQMDLNVQANPQIVQVMPQQPQLPIISPTSQVPPSAYQTIIKPIQFTFQRIVMHTRQVISLNVINNHLISASQDGVCRIFNPEGQSCFCFRAENFITAANVDDKFVIFATKNRIFLHNLAKIGKLEPYADVADQLITNLKDLQGNYFYQLKQPCTLIKKLKTKLFIFQKGQIDVLEVSQQGFQLLSSQMFGENGEKLGFATACVFQDQLYIIQQLQYLRCLSITEDLQVKTIQNQNLGTPVVLLPFQKTIVACLATGPTRFAYFDGEKQQFVGIQEALQERITAACSFSNKMFVAVLGEKALVVIYQVEEGESVTLKKDKILSVEDLCGGICSLVVHGNNLLIGGYQGEIICKQWM